MEKGYLFRIYPNKKQKEIINKTFGCTRYVYNHFLDRRKLLYENEGKSLSYSKCSKELTELKKELEWLKEPDKFSLQNSLRDLDKAFEKFFKEGAGYPKFKSKKDRNKSYRTNFTNGNIEFLGNKIKIPKVGKIRCRGYKEIQGKILNATVSQVPSGKYYISLCCEGVEIEKHPKSNNSVGIDLGIKEFAITSNGCKYENPKYLEKSLKKLAKLQKELSRKTKGGSNWNKNRIKVAKLHDHISNQRNDYLNKLSTKLIKENDIICIEDLKIANMLKNHKLARIISDVSWSKFVEELEYKANWHDRKIIKIDTFYASSQICSNCGYKNEKVKDLSVREWVCPECGACHDRDINASINILNEGMKKAI